MKGSIRKRKHCKSSWELRFDVQPDGGARSQRSITVRGTKQDAERELRKIMAEADKGLLPKRSAITVSDYARQWLGGASASRSPKTVERYEQLIAKQIEPHIGEIPIQQLKATDITALHATLLSGKRPLSRRTVLHVHRLLSLILSFAVSTGIASRNVVGLVKPPKPDVAEIEVLEPEEAERLLAGLATHKTLFPIASLALFTGMRRGEVVGLRWSDVDLDKGILRVERSVEETKAGLRIKPPKSRAGKRSITLPQKAIALLRTHRAEQLRTRLALGQGKQPDDAYVFSTIEGDVIWPDRLTQTWARVVRLRGLPDVTFHALRHTHVSMLIAAGEDILTISRRLGHGKPSVTLDTYGHLFSGADAKAAAAIDKAFRG